MKREREFDHSVTVANCLMLLSRGSEIEAFSNSPSRVFECKTCNRQFSSFQALGGHRASHKKPRLMGGEHGSLDSQSQGSPPKPKTHECSVCGLEFAIGQALGGHMRRHRTALNESQVPLNLTENMQGPLSFTSSQGSATNPLSFASSQGSATSPLSFASSQGLSTINSRRALCLDLNLTPFENDLVILKLKPPPMVDCYL